MSDLLLTLGHNASAIALSIGDDGRATVENAYELERLSGVKSDSRFPLDAMIALKDRGTKSFDRVYVTHWDPVNQVGQMKEKYWDPSVFPSNVPIVTQESRGMTHHDCHAQAALAFAGDDFPKRDAGVLVMDGFGNYGEHMSYYRLDDQRRPVLVKRIYGYHTSLGLMYQYATAFLGMKMHEDEYKLLGYGSHADEICDLTTLGEIVISETKALMKQIRTIKGSALTIDLASLPLVQENWARRFESILDKADLKGHPSTSFEARCIVGFVVQGVLESVVRNMFASDIMKPTNLIMTGGVAFNVELNRALLNIIPGKLCVMPLAGDQGNSLGLWAACNRRAKLDFGDLCWGKRNFHFDGDAPEGLIVVDEDGDDVLGLIHESLRLPGFVNLVRGNMEFGPRALCNTTTLARANDESIVAEINRINGRDSVMPFAPVVAEDRVRKFFPDFDRLHKSGSFMIAALTYDQTLATRVPGAALLTARSVYTGRPQAYVEKYANDSVARVLSEYGLLINTSFNVHGVPICLDMKDVIHSHQFQHNLNPKVRTIVITNQGKS